MPPPAFGRTDSSSSLCTIASADASDALSTPSSPGGLPSSPSTTSAWSTEPVVEPAPRRARRRFSSFQLVLLEQLYYANTHPSREERERISAAGDMPIRSVTVWFQNKRQLERKVKADPWADDAPSSDGIPFPSSSSAGAPEKATGTLASSSRFNRSMSQGTSVFALPPKASRTGITRAHSLSSLSLDKVAARRQCSSPQHPPQRTTSSIRFPTISDLDDPETPVKLAGGLQTILENLPPSPETPQRSPGTAALSPEAARDFVEHGRRKRSATLEWACAAARLSRGQKRAKAVTPIRKPKLAPAFELSAEDAEGELPTLAVPRSGGADISDETDEESHEAVTPRGTLDGDDERWGMLPVAAVASPPWAVPKSKAVKTPAQDQHDQEMLAALALCGLGRRH